MRRNILIIILAFSSILLQLAFKYHAETPAQEAGASFRSSTKMLLASIEALEQHIENFSCNTSTDSMQIAYRQVRKIYKHSEIFTEYFASATAKMLNGALVASADEEDGTQQIFDPEGLQVIEEIIFSDEACDQRNKLLREIKRIKAAAFRLQHIAASQQIAEWQLFDAMRQEFIRITALGISGFDAPASGDGVIESAYALESIIEVLKYYKGEKYDLWQKALDYLHAHPDFDSFDRMHFIREYVYPLSQQLYSFQRKLNIISLDVPTAFNKDAESFLDEDAFNPFFYSPYYRTNKNPKAMEELGRILFFDPVLSGNLQRSCASCHIPEKAFSDGLEKSVGFGGDHQVARNAPSLVNVALQNNYFWDGRVNYLEEQVETVAQNAEEMHGNLHAAAMRVKGSREYDALFARAFPAEADSGINASGIRRAIAAYERSLLAFNSRFDRYIRKQGNTLNKDEISGFNLFMGKAACGTCHFMPLFSGMVPPLYTESEWEILGVPALADSLQPAVDSDQGRYLAKNINLHKGAFKTPGIRNIALTAPYMHNGVYQTLEEVLAFYNRGGGAGAGENIPYQTLPSDPLELTAEEQQQIIAFMRSLTDYKDLVKVPSSLPALKDESLNKRKVRGVY